MSEFNFSEGAVSYALEAAKKLHEDSQSNPFLSGADYNDLRHMDYLFY